MKIRRKVEEMFKKDIMLFKKISKAHLILLLVLLIALAIRLFLAFHVDNLTYDSYYHIRQVEHIMETGLPNYEDELSYGGRELRFLPLFYYFSALIFMILPFSMEIDAIILGNIFFICLALVTYLTSKAITRKDHAPIFSAIIAAFLPISYQTNSFTPVPFSLLLIFLAFYFFLDFNLSKKKRNLYLFLVTLIVLLLSSSLTAILVVSLLSYIIIANLADKRASSAELELSLFSLFIFLWSQFIFFKEIFLTLGISFIWQNIPNAILSQYFPRISIIDSLILLGIVPFLTALYLIYTNIFEESNKKIFLMFCIAISSTIMAWFRLLEFQVALSFLGLVLAILFSPFYENLVSYYKRTKLSTIEKKTKQIKRLTKFKTFLSLITILILLPSLIVPAVSYSLSQETPTDSEIECFKWLIVNGQENEEDVVISNLKEGNLVTYYSEKKNLMDDQFSLIPDIEQRFKDLNSLYVSKFQTQVIGLADIYDIKYIVLTESSKELYGIEDLSYTDNDCFELVYNEAGDKIYKIICTLN